jgi:hypothetical protein
MKVWITLIIGLVIQILFDPLSSIIHLSETVETRIGLPLARNRWNTQKIAHYRFDVYMWSQNGPCVWTGNLEVKDQVVITAGRRSDWPGPYGDPYPELPTFEPGPDTEFLCNYHNFTMPKLFDELERSLEASYPVSQISFDRRYGFISEVQFGNPGERGLLSAKIADCCYGFRLEKFEVLEQ